MEAVINLATLILTLLKEPTFAVFFISAAALAVAAMAIYGMTKAIKRDK